MQKGLILIYRDSAESWWESNIKWHRKTFLCMLCALCWQSWGWKYLRYGLGEDVTWLVGPEHCYPGFKVSTAHGEMLSHWSGGLNLGCACCVQGTALGKSCLWFPNAAPALAHNKHGQGWTWVQALAGPVLAPTVKGTPHVLLITGKQ